MHTASPQDAASISDAMTHEELLAHQLNLHHKIQQQMQLQMEMSMQLGSRQSLTSSLAKVEPDLGDNVFDMLDDLIMIPSGAVPPERSSLSKHTREETVDDDPPAVGSGSVGGSRDSLADILESLDMDLDDEMNDEIMSSGSERAHSTSDSLDEGDLDDLDDLENYDPDDIQDQRDGLYKAEPNEIAPADEELVHMRRSSLDLLASMRESTSGIAHHGTGNMCTLIWEGGLLGLRLRLSQSRLMPAVSKITGKSSIFGVHLVEVGDLLLRIGDRVTREMEFLDAINYLKEVPKPCTLVFQRLLADPMAVKPVQPKVKSAIGLKLAAKFDELTAAENEKFPPQPAVKFDAKYEIKWMDGPLGISLIASKDVPYPLVTRITGKNRSPQVQDVQPGHYLVQIGTYNTADGNFNTAIKFLQKVQKPVSLFFCPSSKKMSLRPDLADDEYDHIWEKKQPLCFTVRPSVMGHIVVADLGSAKSIKVKMKGAPNNVAAFVSSGDRIMWINDDIVKDLTFHESLLKLRTAKRPLVIRFKKGSPEDAIAAYSSSDVHVASKFTNSTVSLGSSSTSVSSSTSTTVMSPSHSITSSNENALPTVPHPKTGQPLAVPLPSPRTFINPLKKMSIALGNHAKDNVTGSSNPKAQEELRKHQDRQYISQSQQHSPLEVVQNKYRSHGEQDTKRAGHDNTRQLNASSSNVLRHSPHGSRGKPHQLAFTTSTKDPAPRTLSSPNHSSAHQNDLNHRIADPANKLRNLEHGPHKSILAKSPIDPIDDTPLKPLSGGRQGSTPPSLSHEPSRHREKEMDKDDDVYEVIWPEGTALGLTLRVHPTTRFPVVARVTGTSNLKNIEHVSPGDILFAANNMNIVPQPKFKQTLENLSRLPKPAILRFRRVSATTSASLRSDESDQMLPRGPALKDREYELIWRESANLGLVFSSDNDVPKVTKVDMDSGGPMLHKVSVGDVLTWIGPMEISGSTFQSSMAKLRAVKRPIVLRFYKRGT
ncbi:PDZ domain [Plasmopara halstedii]|uniref:PDZ domain n=1 Tax=Plasmopara halstedii TaxID=4781 RepID=A0A0P1AD23_PLAHL|nr:PDZ domain [Plasmopara halstedii]CEG38293.1 PDZ domain [Plasmopara halstedii]|eukprot:XP_024574662.1 PDZ domain [Plasmopara halstedii]